jgi:hypothetical protein
MTLHTQKKGQKIKSLVKIVTGYLCDFLHEIITTTNLMRCSAMNHHGKEIDVEKKNKFQILKLSPKRKKEDFQ